MQAYIHLLNAIFAATVLHCLAGDIIMDNKDDKCRLISSCYSCLAKTECTWCVAKSMCTKQLCGNDNSIYPRQVPALMSGPEFCPRVFPTEKMTYKSGKRQIIAVKIQEIYIFMAFTPWKCQINLNDKEYIVPAVLIGETVYCESFEMKNVSEKAYIEGDVKVLWNYNKAFDGSLPFKVCRCDLEPNCIACKKKEDK